MNRALIERTLAAMDKGYEASAYLEYTAVMEALRQELEKDEPEPVAWRFVDDRDNNHPTYRSTPPTPEQAAYLAKWERPSWEPLYTKGTTNV